MGVPKKKTQGFRRPKKKKPKKKKPKKKPRKKNRGSEKLYAILRAPAALSLLRDAPLEQGRKVGRKRTEVPRCESCPRKFLAARYVAIWRVHGSKPQKPQP